MSVFSTVEILIGTDQLHQHPSVARGLPRGDGLQHQPCERDQAADEPKHLSNHLPGCKDGI